MQTLSRSLRFAFIVGLASLPILAQTSLVTITGSSGSQNLGASVSRLGDVDGDGHVDYAIGSPTGFATFPPGRVAAYSGASHTPLWTRFGPTATDRYGAALANAGDVNADGIPDLIVGAPERGPQGFPGGLAQVISGVDGSVLHSWTGTGTDRLGYSVSGAGDIDLDGHDDVLIGAPGSVGGLGFGPGRMEARSGLTGALLYTTVGVTPNGSVGRSVASLGDVDLDGFPDSITSGTAFSLILSGFSGTPLGSLPPSFGVEGPGDLNGDGFPDAMLALGTPCAPPAQCGPGLIGVFSGATGLSLYTVTGSPDDLFGMSMDTIGDVTGDGVTDLIAGAPNHGNLLNYMPGFGTARVISGVDGTILVTFDGSSSIGSQGFAVAGTGDVSGDGVPDFLVGAPGADTPAGEAGQVVLHSGFPVPLAEINQVGAGCGAGIVAPILTATPPVLARTWQIQIGSATPNVGGILFASTMPPANLAIGGGCLASVNPFFMFSVATFSTTSAGTWEFNVTLPATPSLAGQSIVLQAIAAPTMGPLGFDLTNGLEASFGW